MAPSYDEIQAEVAKLKEMRPNVRHYTAFGDNNHAAIWAQINVMEEDLDEDDVYSFYDDNEHVLGAALAAWEWLCGTENDAPSIGWAPLIGG